MVDTEEGLRKLVEVLLHPRTREAVKQWYLAMFNELQEREAAKHISAPGLFEPLFYAIEDDFFSSPTNPAPSSRDAGIRRLFQNYVLKKLRPPLILTTEDFLEAMLDCLRVAPEHFDIGYELFVGTLAHRKLQAEELPAFPVCDQPIKFVSGDFEEAPLCNSEAASQSPEIKLSVEDRTLWHRNGLRLVIMENVQEHQAFPTILLDPVYANVEGNASPGAMRQAHTLLKQAVPTVLHCISSSPPSRRFPAVSLSDLLANRSFIMRALDTYFDGEANGDEMARRVRFTLDLLSHADQQDSDSLSVALCVSALEGLLLGGEKGSNTGMFCENFAILMEPNRKQRDNAEKFAKQLYDQRSKVLHAVMVDYDWECRSRARYVVARTLTQILERRAFLQRLGQADKAKSQQDLIEEFRKQKWEGAIDVGTISPDPATSLWRRGL